MEPNTELTFRRPIQIYQDFSERTEMLSREALNTNPMSNNMGDLLNRILEEISGARQDVSPGKVALQRVQESVHGRVGIYGGTSQD